MANFFADNSFSIGNTPLVKINRMAQGLKAIILANIEGRKPAYSVKCRIGASMIWDAEKRGLLRPGMEIVEPTSGNTGIAPAFVAAARGYKLTVTMPETASIERRKVMAIFGANVILTPAGKGMAGAVAEAERLTQSNPNSFMPQQFQNPANPEIHFKTTGPEIWEQTGGKIDVLVSNPGYPGKSDLPEA
jgi:cysteine synthase A